MSMMNPLRLRRFPRPLLLQGRRAVSSCASLEGLLAASVDLSAKTVLVRADLNVPLSPDEPGVITNDKRIRAVAPTLRQLVDAGAKVRPSVVGAAASPWR